MSATVTALNRSSLPAHVSLAGSRFTLVDENGAMGDSLPVLVAGVVYVAPSLVRLYYADPYSEKDKAAPLCLSYDNVAPHESAKDPQAERCAGCQWSKFGSATVGTGEGQACSQRHPIVLVPVGSDKPYYLHVPPASLGAWADYSAWLVNQARAQGLDRQGIELLPLVQTEVSFTPGKTGRLQFRAIGFLSEQQLRGHEALDDADLIAMVGPPQDYTPPGRPQLAAPAAKPALRAPTAAAEPPKQAEAPKRSRGRPAATKEPAEPPPQADFGSALFGAGSSAAAPGLESALFGASGGPEPEFGGSTDAPETSPEPPAESIEAMMSRALGIG